MTAISRHKHRRATIYAIGRRLSEGGWQADILHLAGSIALIAVLIVLRLAWAQHGG